MTLRWPTLRVLRIAVPVLVPVVVVMVLMVRGCETASVPLVHPPPGVTLPPPTPSTVAVDLTGVQLAAVDGTTTVPASRTTGTAQLSGTVTGPQGPVPNAVVRIERLAADRPPPSDVAADPAGHWGVAGLPGGRYRVRAFLAPTLAQTEPQVFFLADGEQRALDLTVEAFSGLTLAAAIAPDPPQLGQPANLAVRVARRTVDSDGVVRAQPLAGATVTITTANGYAVTSPSTAATNAAGDAAFVVECRTAGASQVQVSARATATDAPQPATLDVSACVDPRATSTTADASGSSSSSSSSGASTTTKPAPPTTAPN